MNLIPKNIIKEAIEKGGYEQVFAHYSNEDVQRAVLLDPLFWQYLGKARPWKKDVPTPGELTRGWNGGEWKYHAQKFYELLLSSPSQEQIDAFWAELP